MKSTHTNRRLVWILWSDLHGSLVVLPKVEVQRIHQEMSSRLEDSKWFYLKHTLADECCAIKESFCSKRHPFLKFRCLTTQQHRHKQLGTPMLCGFLALWHLKACPFPPIAFRNKQLRLCRFLATSQQHIQRRRIMWCLEVFRRLNLSATKEILQVVANKDQLPTISHIPRPFTPQFLVPGSLTIRSDLDSSPRKWRL